METAGSIDLVRRLREVLAGPLAEHGFVEVPGDRGVVLHTLTRGGVRLEILGRVDRDPDEGIHEVVLRALVCCPEVADLINQCTAPLSPIRELLVLPPSPDAEGPEPPLLVKDDASMARACAKAKLWLRTRVAPLLGRIDRAWLLAELRSLSEGPQEAWSRTPLRGVPRRWVRLACLTAAGDRQAVEEAAASAATDAERSVTTRFLERLGAGATSGSATSRTPPRAEPGPQDTSMLETEEGLRRAVAILNWRQAPAAPPAPAADLRRLAQQCAIPEWLERILSSANGFPVVVGGGRFLGVGEGTPALSDGAGILDVIAHLRAVDEDTAAGRELLPFFDCGGGSPHLAVHVGDGTIHRLEDGDADEVHPTWKAWLTEALHQACVIHATQLLTLPAAASGALDALASAPDALERLDVLMGVLEEHYADRLDAERAAERVSRTLSVVAASA